MMEVNKEVAKRCEAVNLMCLEGFASGLVAGIMKAAARGMVPSFKHVRAFQDIQNLQQQIIYGDATTLFSNINAGLPAQATVPVSPGVTVGTVPTDPNKPPAWAQQLIDSNKTLTEKVAALEAK